MKVIDKLKLHKFRPVSIPKNKDLYARVGGRIPSTGTGGFVASFNSRKLEDLAGAEEYMQNDYMNSLKANQQPIATEDTSVLPKK